MLVPGRKADKGTVFTWVCPRCSEKLWSVYENDLRVLIGRHERQHKARKPLYSRVVRKWKAVKARMSR